MDQMYKQTIVEVLEIELAEWLKSESQSKIEKKKKIRKNQMKNKRTTKD